MSNFKKLPAFHLGICAILKLKICIF
uniref:Uncharacterized protein n=1 Tax=Wuchereria bancrofti TaxID=6293 RepID=A0AAF5PL36_WUCBA